ncbi:SufD family Fe-S cluster assembly protein [Wohlfahrtiimonas chitiniclastica]|uniref:FeS cluster assembly protein sufD n=2 Tax=Wohlfahrtiimonas chitiniclastica TaxID=400946 RepID=L8XY58_9GAMM|nr:SufD family Fe-S cluster assembly protein [Wohlfahrtiimonas chitiniclastica]ELV07749.1 FeS cluster assembly protein sufD [Wohlfahrtiimonas chitiniclastica SH04]KZS23368.1 Fe-S cluster assembly protein SufD [Wohlfahrtiimonas chitiniclastica]MBS7815431.1 SufD family Fe-S cluster assembly protein [Wohlfahrtiimonas chitiniclastica]MBS7819511.1 SufD family Fe-S cluster assembly protein [Wohlfahrtiimonas chitiniclastica]MBS7825259.1 SufD family Fe-S cluster assembly protein [Wohlfahrtiimonas chit
MLQTLTDNLRLERWRETPLKRVLSTEWQGAVAAYPQLMPADHTMPEKCFVLTVVNGEVNPQWFNENLVPEGVLITLEKGKIQLKVIPNTDIATPFVIYNYTVSEEGARTADLDISVEVGDESKLTVLFVEAGKGQYLSSPKVAAKVGQAATLNWLKMSLNPEMASSFYEFECDQAAESATSILHYQAGGDVVRSDITVHLKGEMSHSNFIALNLGSGKQSLENVMTLHHEVPHCTSEQSIKNLLADNANALFDGMINVHQDAQKTDANQLTRSILLSDKARAMTIPRLEIYADDVRCTHGATVGFLEPESLFYLRSRGIELQEAQAMLLLSYAAEFLGMIEHETVKEWMHKQLENDLTSVRPA